MSDIKRYEIIPDGAYTFHDEENEHGEYMYAACVQLVIAALESRVKELEAENARLTKQYHELLFAVGRKFDNESRHETALRYIQEAENRATQGDAKEQHHG